MDGKIIIFAAVLASALQNFQESDTYHYMQCMHQAESYMEQGEYWSACNSYDLAQEHASTEKQLARAQEGEYQAWLERGREYMEADAYDSAINVYKMMADQWKDRGEIYQKMADIYEQQEDYGNMMEALKQGASCGDEAAGECAQRARDMEQNLRLTGRVCYEDGEKDYKETYDSQGRLVEKESYKNDRIWAYEYAEDGGYSEYRYQREFLEESSSYGKGMLMEESYYDAEEKLLKEINYEEDGSVHYQLDCSYDEDGNKISDVGKYGDGDIVRSDYTYDAAGNLAREVYSYQDAENEERSYQTVTTYDYDAAGNMVHRIYTSEEDGLVEESATRYVRDGAGNVLEEVYEYKTYGKSDGKIYYYSTSRDEYAYDEQGNEVSCRHYGEGSLTYERTAEYDYDEEGRLVRCTECRKDYEYYIKEDYVYFYDEDGEVTLQYYRSYGDDWETVDYEEATTYEKEYDEEGRLLRELEECKYSSGRTDTAETLYTYDFQGNQASCERWSDEELRKRITYENIYEWAQ